MAGPRERASQTAGACQSSRALASPPPFAIPASRARISFFGPLLVPVAVLSASETESSPCIRLVALQ